MYEPADSLAMCVLPVFTLGNKIICSRSDRFRGRAAGGNVQSRVSTLDLFTSNYKIYWPYSSTWRKRRSKRPGGIITRDHF